MKCFARLFQWCQFSGHFLFTVVNLLGMLTLVPIMLLV
jgi:hypothetical protein